MKQAIVIAAFVVIFAQFVLVGAEQVIDTDTSGGVTAIDTIAPSINPDSFFWGFKDALDKFSLALTFDSEAKAKKSITIAEERFHEFQKMAEEGKLEAAKKAKESHDEFLEKAKSAAKSISEGNKTEEIKKQIEIEREVEKLRNKTEIITERLKIKIMTEGNLTAEQKALIDSLIASMQNQTGSLKIEIKQNKEKIKLEIKARTNKTKEEIEDAVEKIEKEHNITKGKLDEAFENIIDAWEEIAKLNDEIGMNNIMDNAVLVLLNNSLDKLDAAQDAIDSSKYGEAYGLANAAKQLAENAREKIRKLTENDGEHEREKERNQTRNETKEREPKMCAQVITPAKNEKTGECREFPTPCNVPDGWGKVETCSGGNELVVSRGVSFELFNESYQNYTECEKLGIPPVTGGCILQNVSYDKTYVSEAESRIVGDCWTTKTHVFIGLKKGETEITTKGTCDYAKTYKIKIV